MDVQRASKRLSYVLRHAPDSVGLQLDAAGWVGVDELLAAMAAHGVRITRAELERLVEGSDKQRFAFDGTGNRIRASQGHSVPVELGYEPQQPPPVLYHGTSTHSVAAILREGLKPGSRHAVHLSPDVATAIQVGRRRGEFAILRVDAQALAVAGTEFTRSANGVWLVAAVPPEFLRVE